MEKSYQRVKRSVLKRRKGRRARLVNLKGMMMKVAKRNEKRNQLNEGRVKS